ncbi:MAG: glycosyltransferase family 61 protein [Pseudomonadota bacterium]
MQLPLHGYRDFRWTGAWRVRLAPGAAARQKALGPLQERVFQKWFKQLPPVAPNAPPGAFADDPDYDRGVRVAARTPRWSSWHSFPNASIGPRDGRIVTGGLMVPRTALVPGAEAFPRKKQVKHWLKEMVWTRRRVDVALSLRNWHRSNFWHDFTDVAGRLVMAADHPELDGVPVLVSEAFAKSSLGTALIDSPLFAGREVIVQGERDIVRVDNLILLQTPLYDRGLIDRVAAVIPSGDWAQTPPRRIVLIRNAGNFSRRSCRGYDVLVANLVARGFTAIDPATLSIAAQKRLFETATHIVTENGAALTNMVFAPRGQLQLDVLVGVTAATETFQLLSYLYGHRMRTHLVDDHDLPDGRKELILDRQTAAAILDVCPRAAEKPGLTFQTTP